MNGLKNKPLFSRYSNDGAHTSVTVIVTSRARAHTHTPLILFIGQVQEVQPITQYASSFSWTLTFWNLVLPDF